VALLSTLPDADRGWFESAGADEVFALEASGELKLIHDHPVAFRCGCTSARIVQVLFRLFGDDPEGLFRGDPSVEAECPRCGGKHQVPRAAFDAAAPRA
jgi:redox-regulated HSP33 family molecular chaperone